MLDAHNDQDDSLSVAAVEAATKEWLKHAPKRSVNQSKTKTPQRRDGNREDGNI